MVSKKDLNKAELEIVRISKNPTMVVPANGEVPAKEEATVYVPRIGYIRDGNASRKYTGSSFTGKTLRRIWVQLPLDQWPETTSHERWQEISSRHIKLCTIRCPWFMQKTNYVPFVVPGLLTSSSTSSSSTSPTSSSQEAVTDTEIPPTRRSGSTDELTRSRPVA